MIKIPSHFFQVSHKGAYYPGAVATNGLEGGANCQVFAYEILRYFGKVVPDLRSSNLWEDQLYYDTVEQLEPLDLLLWNKTAEAWGAHLGLYLGDGQAIHLAKAQKTAVIWPLEKFLEDPLHKVFIGAKRLKEKPPKNLDFLQNK